MPENLSKTLKENLEEFKGHYPEGAKYEDKETSLKKTVQEINEEQQNLAGYIPKTYEGFLTENAENTYPFLDSSVVKLIKDFLFFKLKHEPDMEQRNFYVQEYPNLHEKLEKPEDIPQQVIQKFIERLITQRPLVFYLPDDYTLDRPEVTQNLTYGGQGGYVNKTKRQKPTKDYISYEEMQISAFLQVSSPSLFINNGNRKNKQIFQEDKNFIHQGIMVGSVGARFEVAEKMEYQHMFITQNQNTSQKGYGEGAQQTNSLFSIWAKFYGITHFPSYQEAEDYYESQQKDATLPKKYLLVKPAKPKEKNRYLNIDVYKKRMKKVIEAFLIEANARGSMDQKAYVHAVGLGSGVWAIDGEQQERLMLDVYAEVLSEHTFENISDIDFSWWTKKIWEDNPEAKPNKGIILDKQLTKNPHINVCFSAHNPNEYSTTLGDRKTKEYMKDKILISQYAWDSGSFAGNEYWFGSLEASGDPAAAACSQIAELQNPLVNPGFTKKIKITDGSSLTLLSPEEQTATLEIRKSPLAPAASDQQQPTSSLPQKPQPPSQPPQPPSSQPPPEEEHPTSSLTQKPQEEAQPTSSLPQKPQPPSQPPQPPSSQPPPEEEHPTSSLTQKPQEEAQPTSSLPQKPQPPSQPPQPPSSQPPPEEEHPTSSLTQKPQEEAQPTSSLPQKPQPPSQPPQPPSSQPPPEEEHPTSSLPQKPQPPSQPPQPPSPQQPQTGSTLTERLVALEKSFNLYSEGSLQQEPLQTLINQTLNKEYLQNCVFQQASPEQQLQNNGLIGTVVNTTDQSTITNISNKNEDILLEFPFKPDSGLQDSQTNWIMSFLLDFPKGQQTDSTVFVHGFKEQDLLQILQKIHDINSTAKPEDQILLQFKYEATEHPSNIMKENLEIHNKNINAINSTRPGTKPTLSPLKALPVSNATRETTRTPFTL